MAEKDPYMKEAYDMLDQMSADEKNGWSMRRERRQSGTIIHRCIVHGNKE